MNTYQNKPLIILGGGGHAKVLVDILKICKYPILGFTEIAVDPIILDIAYLGYDEVITKYNPHSIQLVNGIGSVPPYHHKRKEIYEKFKSLGYFFASVIHPTAILSPNSVIGEGVQIMAGAVMQTGSIIKENSIINTRASVDHDCIIDKHVHIAPGAILSGNVHIHPETHIGTGANIIQSITIHAQSIVGSGAVVTKDIPSYHIVYPARSAIAPRKTRVLKEKNEALESDSSSS